MGDQQGVHRNVMYFVIRKYQEVPNEQSINS